MSLRAFRFAVALTRLTAEFAPVINWFAAAGFLWLNFAFENPDKCVGHLQTRQSCVIPTEAIVSLGIPNDEGNVGAQHHWIHSLVVMKIPLESVALEVKVSRNFENELNLKVHLVE
jgi:hypothetical protein